MSKNKTYRERILDLPWIDEISVEPEGIFIYLKPWATWDMLPDGFTEMPVADQVEALHKSYARTYRADNWREALRVARHEAVLLEHLKDVVPKAF